MIIKILGSGCKSCSKLESNVQDAVTQLGLDVSIQKVDDFNEISKLNILKTPALVIDGQVVSYGRVNSVDEIKEMLT